MKKMFCCTLLALCLLLTACTTPPIGEPDNLAEQHNDPAAQQPPTYKEIDLSDYFGDTPGCAVFYSVADDYTVYNLPGSDARFSPCSSFKIVSTLAALDAGVITAEDSVRTWDGTDWPFDAWKADLSVDEAFKSSCVWYYRLLTDEVGQDRMTAYLKALDYGNGDVSEWAGSGLNGLPAIDGFWLESSLTISAQEQVAVLLKIFEGGTDFRDEHVAALKEMMYRGDLEGGYKLYGKTGSGNGGWFVGFWELGMQRTYFAVRLDSGENATGPTAQKITENILQGVV